MESKLSFIFSNINDWLKFAEAKSATLLACNAGLTFGIVRFIASSEIEGFGYLFLALSVVLCIISIALCILSVIPSLEMPWEKKPSGTNENDNLIFFSDIAKYTPLSYLQSLERKLGLKNSDFSGYETDLASQIITNSVIAHSKYKRHQIAIWLTFGAVVSPLIGVIIYIFGGSQ